jgi:hypothetical protein
VSDLIISMIRTGSAALAGALITWAVRQGLLADNSVTQPLTEVLVVAFSAAYYWLVRLLETFNPIFGYLLGYPAAPTYVTLAQQRQRKYAALHQVTPEEPRGETRY